MTRYFILLILGFFKIMNTLPSISEHIDEKKINKVIKDISYYKHVKNNVNSRGSLEFDKKK